ncbi:MAG TPA: asparagine synthase-related protein [Methylomirabilota bacterium]
MEPTELDAASARLAHRGPDGAGAWREGPIGLAHRLFVTVPESVGERQPLVSADRQVVLAADARLDNREELAAALGVGAGAGPDSALVLAAWERWGERCAERLLGDFAFALWDARRRCLFAARDHMGVKPLYYHLSDRLFACASELSPLLALPDVSGRLDDAHIAGYLLGDMPDLGATFYRDVRRLPPAHWLTVATSGARRERYWALDPGRELRLKSDDEYAEAFRAVFGPAVGARLRAPEPVGSFLSGGLDSSAIVCTARQQLAQAGRGPLHTFSLLYPDVPEASEEAYVKAVVGQGGVAPHYVTVPGLEPFDRLQTWLDRLGQPYVSPNLSTYAALCRDARVSGVRCLLDGFDGDVVVSHGIRRLADLALSLRWLTLRREIRGLCANFGWTPRQVLWRQAIRPLVPPSALALARRLAGRPAAGADARALLGPALRERRSSAPPARDEWARRRTARLDHHFRLTRWEIPLAFETAHVVMAHEGLELRFPFFDRRVVELCLALPADQKLRGGWSRIVLRHALGPLYPPEVAGRGGKAGIATPFVSGVIAARPLVERVLGGAAGDPYVVADAIRHLGRNLPQTRSNDEALRIWKGTALLMWLHRRDARREDPGCP